MPKTHEREATQDQERAGPRRRPAAGGYARGEEKRIRILEAAVRRFGEDGYDGASTRQIAQEAGVNPPALQYYFDSKEGLYAACLVYIVDGFSAEMQEIYARAEKVASGDKASALAIFCDLLDAMADFLFETSEANGWRRFYGRIKARDGCGPIEKPEPSSQEKELLGHCYRLVGVAIGQPPASETTRLRTMVAMGALSAFHVERETMLQRLGWPDLRGPRLSKLKALIRRQAEAAIMPE